jgi:uncharacterized protein YjbI with pentapeptide repeats
MDAEAARELNEVLLARREGEARPAHFPARDLSEAIALAADLAGANLEGAILENACLAGARLTRANLRGANLRGCDLDGADLSEADLTNADLTCARLDDAVMTRTVLRGACLESTLGDPLSMNGAIVDKRALDRSRFRIRDIAQLVVRGAAVSEKDSVPPSAARAASHSIVPLLRLREQEARQQRADEDLEMPASLRSFREMNALIQEARTSDAPPPSIRPRPPASSRRPVAPEPGATEAEVEVERPDVGGSYLGVALERRLYGSRTCLTFLGTDATGAQVVVKVFDPECDGAELQLPAFQRGLRALNKLQASGDPDIRVAELIAVAVDQTGYVVRHYENGSVENLVDVARTLQGGVEVLHALAKSVHAMHECGVLVRSLKPSNVLIDGLSPLIGEIDAVDLPTLAQSRGDLAGYGSYAAPEEIVGMGTRSPTADVYALGRLLEFLVTGHEPIAPVGAPPVIADQEGVPQVLVEIVRRCIAKDPSERYQYASDLLDDLTTFERQGAKAALRASIRPAGLSRLKSGPTLGDLTPRQREPRAPAKVPSLPPPRWLPRRLELLLASVGVLTTLAVSAVLLLSPSSVDDLETVPRLAAPLAALVLWYLPVPRRATALLRLGSWLSLTLLIWVADPVRLATVRWKWDLEHGSDFARESAVARLLRVGERDFRGRDLRGLRLGNRDLAGVDFRGARLAGTDLSKAFAMDVVLDGADITGANVRGTDLRGAVITPRTRGVTTVVCDGLTRPPEGYFCRRGRLRRSAAPKP